MDQSRVVIHSGAELRSGLIPAAAVDIPEVIATFPKTRFYGSKRRVLDWIYRSTKDLPFNSVLDGFGGTASVSLLFQAMGKQVTYHDALLSNTVSAQALLLSKVSNSDLRAFHAFVDAIKPQSGFIYKTFRGMYFTEAENAWLDGAARSIHALPDRNLRSVYLYCLFQACLRKRPFNLFHRANLNLRLNTTVSRSFGNWVTWERSFPDLMREAADDLSRIAVGPSLDPSVLVSGDVGRLRGRYDLVYLDPPYVNKAKFTETYLQRYHFLEGLSRYHEWPRHLDGGSSIRSIRPYSHITAWQHKRTFKEKLFNLITAHRHSIVVLSYISGAYPSEREITKHFRSTFNWLQVRRKGLDHALAKARKTELLFIGGN